ncbi:hypothetical protein VNO80_00248 [Phaseolus coccineus]|uniref:Pentatricopeptide repeat-containing protein n=1 Tax=Phaseolus coccineus TaxID=3886 RepID=A0AAN9NYP8_PHACN
MYSLPRSPHLTLCLAARRLTMQLHCKIVKLGLELFNTVCNASITAYSDCCSLQDAERVFDGAVACRDVVTWNSILSAYLMHEKEDLAFKVFIDMQNFGFEPDTYTYTGSVSACSVQKHNSHGKCLHGMVIKSGLEDSVPISNALIAMYIRFNDKEIDHYTFSAVIRSCSDLATLQLGQQVHVLALKVGFDNNNYVGSSLIFMYSKCGIIEDARKSFEATSKNYAIVWNSIIFGYAQHGQGNNALDLFHLMNKRKVKPDHTTFVAVLTACSHNGLVEEGCKFIESMESDFGIPRGHEHYACAIDLYGRAGHLEKAKALVETMPFEPDAMVLKTLLGACRFCGDIELASQIAKTLLELEPEDHCSYVILSEMYDDGYCNKDDGMRRLL